MKSLTGFFLLVGVLLASCCMEEQLGLWDKKRNDHEVVTSNPWSLSVLPSQQSNRETDPHVSQFPYYYVFCVPLPRVPLNDFSASLELDFSEQTKEVVIDFDFNGHSFDYVTKDPIKTLQVDLHTDSEDLNGWSSEDGFQRPLGGRVFSMAPLGRVTLNAEGSWRATHDKALLCPQQQQHEKPLQGEDGNQENNNKQKNGPFTVPTLHRKHYPVLLFCVMFLVFFSILMCCCQISTVKVTDEEDVIAEMEQFYSLTPEMDEIEEEDHCQGHNNHDDLIVRDLGEVDDDDEDMRKAKELSRLEYEDKNVFTVGAQREALSQYMQPPVISADAYANYLSSEGLQ